MKITLDIDVVNPTAAATSIMNKLNLNGEPIRTGIETIIKTSTHGLPIEAISNILNSAPISTIINKKIEGIGLRLNTISIKEDAK